METLCQNKSHQIFSFHGRYDSGNNKANFLFTTVFAFNINSCARENGIGLVTV